MTDRQVGGDGLNVDINALPDRRVGAEGLQVDVVPPLVGERQADTLAIQVDYTWPLGMQFGHLGLSLDVQPLASRLLGTLGFMVDFVVALVPTTAVRWPGVAFEQGTAAPLVRWNGVFRVTGTAPIVVWESDIFGFAP